jgi:3',5'-cyclic-AMP phosphodiesterase
MLIAQITDTHVRRKGDLAHPLRGRDALAALVATHPQVVRFIAGHIHRTCEVPFRGTTASTAPSTAHQLVVDRDPSGAYTIRIERPAFALHCWTGRVLATTIVPTGEADGARLRARRTRAA